MFKIIGEIAVPAELHHRGVFITMRAVRLIKNLTAPRADHQSLNTKLYLQIADDVDGTEPYPSMFL